MGEINKSPNDYKDDSKLSLIVSMDLNLVVMQCEVSPTF